MTGKTHHESRHLYSEVKLSLLVLSLIYCTAGLLDGMVGAASNTPRHKVLLYHERTLAVLHAMTYVMRKVLWARKEVRRTETALLVREYRPSQHDDDDILARSDEEGAG